MWMTPGRLLIAGLIALPLAVAILDWPVHITALALVVLLGATWVLVLRRLASGPGERPVLETIPPSHFAEKVRWCMDELGVDYEERVSIGTLGGFFGGRTVPCLHVPTGAVMSRIGNSAEILRYLWGAYGEALGDAAAFLRPTAERVELESRLDRHGVDLQRWIYGHILDHRVVTLRAWGVGDTRIPSWQRWAIRLLFPLNRMLIRRVFRITPRQVAKSRERIEALLAELDGVLADGQGSLLPGGPDYTDLTLAAMVGLWLQPDTFARGEAAAVKLSGALLPAPMAEERERWRERYPALVAHVEALYARRDSRFLTPA